MKYYIIFTDNLSSIDAEKKLPPNSNASSKNGVASQKSSTKPNMSSK